MTRDDERSMRDDELLLASLDLDGHTIDELADYVDAGRMPRDPSIEDSPGCRIAIDALERLRDVAGALFRADIEAEPQPDESWIRGILAGIAIDARAGRRIPIGHPDPAADLAITEGAVRGIIRSAESEVPGVLVSRTRLDGEVTDPNAPIGIAIAISIGYGLPLLATAERLRLAVAARIAEHTELRIEAIDITIDDVRIPAPLPDEKETT